MSVFVEVVAARAVAQGGQTELFYFQKPNYG